MEQLRAAGAQEGEVLRRELARAQMVAASAEAAAEESVGLRRQVRELTLALDEQRVGVESLKAINEELTKRSRALGATNEGLKGAHEVVCKERIEKQRLLHEMETKCKMLEADASAREREMAAFQSAVQQQQQQHQQHQQHQRAQQESLASKSVVSAQSEKEVRDLRQQIAVLSHEKALAISTGEALAQDLNKMERMCAQLHSIQQLKQVTARADNEDSHAQLKLMHGTTKLQAQEHPQKSQTRSTAGAGQQLGSQTQSEERERAVGQEESLSLTRRLLDLERGTGVLSASVSLSLSLCLCLCLYRQRRLSVSLSVSRLL
jgi:hypothetical protein